MTHVKTLLLVALIALGGFALGRLSLNRADAQGVSDMRKMTSDVVYTSSADGKIVYVWRFEGQRGAQGGFVLQLVTKASTR